MQFVGLSGNRLFVVISDLLNFRYNWKVLLKKLINNANQKLSFSNESNVGIMTAKILETIKNEKKAIENWSNQVEELKQTEINKELCDELQEKIRSKLRFIEDLEFEALEKQIAFEEAQQNIVSSSSSSPQSHSMDSDLKSDNSYPSVESNNVIAEKEIINKSTEQNETKQNFQKEIIWEKPFPLCLYETHCTSNKNQNKNEERAMSYSKTETGCGDTLTHHKTNNRPSSVTSSLCQNNHSSNENDWAFIPSKFDRTHNQSASVRSKTSYHTKKASRPLTRYLPNPNDPRFDLRNYIEMCGHNLNIVETHMKIDSHSCYGKLSKLSGTHLKTWKKKSFIFDRNRRILAYYTSSTSTKVKGMISFDQIVNIHAISENTSKFGSMLSTDSHHIFSIQLIDNWNRGRNFKDELRLSAPTAECQRVWMDVIFTGAEAYMTTLNVNRTHIMKNNNPWIS